MLCCFDKKIEQKKKICIAYVVCKKKDIIHHYNISILAKLFFILFSKFFLLCFFMHAWQGNGSNGFN